MKRSPVLLRACSEISFRKKGRKKKPNNNKRKQRKNRRAAKGQNKMKGKKTPTPESSKRVDIRVQNSPLIGKRSIVRLKKLMNFFSLSPI